MGSERAHQQKHWSWASLGIDGAYGHDADIEAARVWAYGDMSSAGSVVRNDKAIALRGAMHFDSHCTRYMASGLWDKEFAMKVAASELGYYTLQDMPLRLSGDLEVLEAAVHCHVPFDALPLNIQLDEGDVCQTLYWKMVFSVDSELSESPWFAPNWPKPLSYNVETWEKLLRVCGESTELKADMEARLEYDDPLGYLGVGIGEALYHICITRYWWLPDLFNVNPELYVAWRKHRLLHFKPVSIRDRHDRSERPPSDRDLEMAADLGLFMRMLKIASEEPYQDTPLARFVFEYGDETQRRHMSPHIYGVRYGDETQRRHIIYVTI